MSYLLGTSEFVSSLILSAQLTVFIGVLLSVQWNVFVSPTQWLQATHNVWAPGLWVGKFLEIFFQNDFTGNFLPLQTFEITAGAYNSTFQRLLQHL